jgi:hypothetical protein
LQPSLSHATGSLITPGTPATTGARTGFYGGIDRRSAVVVRAADAADAAAVARLVD